MIVFVQCFQEKLREQCWRQLARGFQVPKMLRQFFGHMLEVLIHDEAMSWEALG